MQKIDDLLIRKYPEFTKKEDRYGEKVIEDIPVMFGSRGEIICIPKKQEIPSPIACLGKKGTGKSLLLHRICDEVFNNWGANIAIMNDSLEECYDWGLPQNNKKWIEQLEQIREFSMPLPIVFVFSNNKYLNLEEKKITTGLMTPGTYIKEKEINYIKITIPFSEFLENLEKYFKLKGSDPYLRNLIEDLDNCKTINEVFDIVDTISIDEKGKEKGSLKSARDKIKTYLNNVFNEQILHITNPDCPEYLDIGKYRGNPFVALMKLGVVPCFITSNLWTQKYKNQIYAYHINSIFEAMNNDLNKKTYLVFDELTKVCSTSAKDRNNPAEEALNQIAARGRQKNIGLCYATQFYNKIPKEIREMSEYLFAFRHSNKAEVNEIKNDFSLPDLDESELLKLKKLECLGITSEFFRVYYLNGEVEETDKPIKGVIIPSQSRHKLPK